jgi:hypothetical protein
MEKRACSDFAAFNPLRRLVCGPFEATDDLNDIERFVRTVVLHDEMVMPLEPLPFEASKDLVIDQDKYRSMIVESMVEPKREGHDIEWSFNLETNVATPVGFRADTTGFSFFQPLETRFGRGLEHARALEEIKLADPIMDIALECCSRQEDHGHLPTYLLYLKEIFGTVHSGGSVLVSNEWGRRAVAAARRYPEQMFEKLDEDWQKYARQLGDRGSRLAVPPVLGIVLTRCARRDAIPKVIVDLRDEWHDARRRVWELLDALRMCGTLREAVEIDRELADASRLFSPADTALDSRPLRVLWEIVAAGVAGAGVAALSGGKPVIGAVAGAVTQAARNLPAFTHEFGATLFGRGAFDLARRVRREVSRTELDALPRLLTDAEKQKLGL